jgi:hypothetical protein
MLVPVNPSLPFKIYHKLILVAETLRFESEEVVESFFSEAQFTGMYSEA